MTVSKTFLSSALAACFGIALLASGCAQPSGASCSETTSTQNCGACGNVCAAGQLCQSGSCQCGAGLLFCNGQCVQQDTSNCGACNRACMGAQVCSNGTCSTMCATDRPTQCPGGVCANTMTDAGNCGSCGNVCSGGTTCQNGTCACNAGQVQCNGICCGSGLVCVNNACTSPGGTAGTTGQGGGAGGTTGQGGGSAGTTGMGGGRGGTTGQGGGGTTGQGGGGTTGQGGRGGTTGSGGGGTTGAGGASCAITPPPGAVAADVIFDHEQGFGAMIKQGGRTGYWTTYNYSADPQTQTPTEPPAATADKIAVEPAGVCAMSAFHSSATGQDNFVGFGAQFHPNMPLTSSEVADPYDVSQWDGITFRARTGGGPTSQPTFVEILTRETQPASSGGTAMTQAVDQYNNRGFMVDINSTTYKQFFVPFGALIPRSLPAQGSGGNACPAGSNPKCQAPKFVATNALGIQFSWYGPMDTPGFLRPNPVGSYNILVDDVAFYKRSALPSGMSDLPPLPSNGGAHPLTDNPAINSRCMKPAGANPRLLALAYDNWKKRFTIADGGGIKVYRPENANDTVSEGIAYGMMIAVYFDDKPLFDGLYTYWRNHIATNNLMTWCISPNGNPSGGTGMACSASGGTATDADEDAAFAMLMASKQWPNGGYSGTATTLINAVMATDMSGSYIKAGSNYASNGITNPSYFAPAFYRAFGWTSLADNSYTLLNNALQGRTNGLVAAWCETSGSTLCGAPSGMNGGADDRRYQYDSHRIPWRIALDYCWYGTGAAQTYLNKIVGFFAGKGSTGVGRIFDIYELSGTETSNAAVNSGSAIGTAAAGAMGTTQTTFLNDGYQLVLDLLNRGTIGDRLPADSGMPTVKSGYSYFNATVGLLMLLTMSGAFQNW